MRMVKSPGQYFLKAWGDSKIAPGIHYQAVQKMAPMLYAGPLQAELFNKTKVNCDIRESIQQILYFMGYYEAIETYFISQLVKKDQVVVDAGANLGYYSLVMANLVGSGGKVHSFEPVPGNYSNLQNNIALNNFQNIIAANNLGLWHQQETLEFAIADETADNFGSYSAGTKSGTGNSIKCETTTLDSYFAENSISQFDLLKMDIEGAELNALKGAMGVLEKFKPYIVLEVCEYTCKRFGYEPNDIWNLLKPLGYKIKRIGNTSEKCLDLNDFSGIYQANVLLYQGTIPSLLTSNWSLKSLRQSFFNR